MNWLFKFFNQLIKANNLSPSSLNVFILPVNILYDNSNIFFYSVKQKTSKLNKN